MTRNVNLHKLEAAAINWREPTGMMCADAAEGLVSSFMHSSKAWVCRGVGPREAWDGG